MRAVWLRVRAGLRQDWRSPLVLALITGLMGSLVLVSLAGARRTDTAVPRFLAWSGPTEGQVAGVPLLTALQATSLHPARVLGEQRKGRLMPGYDADIVVLDKDLTLVATIVAGRVVHDPRGLFSSLEMALSQAPLP